MRHPLRPGDVVMIERGIYAGRAAVLSIGQRKGGVTRVRAITPKRRVVVLSAADFDRPPRPLAKLELPAPFAPNRQSFQREVARELERARLQPSGSARAERLAPDPLAEHAVNADPDLRERLRRPPRPIGPSGKSTICNTVCAVAASRSLAASTACCASSISGSTSTAGPSPTPGRAWPACSTNVTCS
jgi:hypothetical protein